jgi:transcriptional regulator with PAS, ATPase and Fis domain
VEGAFTGASRGGKPGFFELAHKGTIFLDEISEIPLKLQGRLLRVIQEREIVRIGDDKVTLIDVRIISASNKRLEQISLCGDFREDLYYRLDVLKIHIPSLNERREDIPLLAEKFINEYNSEFSKKTIQFEDGSLKLLQNINWKGNIRQLRNVCERLAVLNKTGIIDAKGINKIILEESLPGCGGTANWDTKDTMSKDSYRKELETKEKKLIEDVLEKYNGNKALAAAILGLSIATLYRRIKKLGIK